MVKLGFIGMTAVLFGSKMPVWVEVAKLLDVASNGPYHRLTQSFLKRERHVFMYQLPIWT